MAGNRPYSSKKWQTTCLQDVKDWNHTSKDLRTFCIYCVSCPEDQSPKVDVPFVCLQPFAYKYFISQAVYDILPFGLRDVQSTFFSL